MPAGVRLTVVTDGQQLDVGTDAIALTKAYLLPQGMHAWSFGGVSDGKYLVFGIEAPAADGKLADSRHEPTQPADKPGRYGVIDLATGRLTVGQTLAAGAYTNYVALAQTSDGASTLVRVEAVEQQPGACPSLPVTCYRWQITAQRLPDGRATVIARSTSPAADTDVPEPVEDGRVVAWLDTTTHGTSRLYVWQPGSRPRAIGPAQPTGLLSLTAGTAWIGTPYNSVRLTRLPLGAGEPTSTQLPATAALALVRGDQVAYRVDLPNGDRAVCTASVRTPRACRQVLHSSDIYSVGWIGNHELLISTPDGYSVTTDRGAGIASTTLNNLYLVHEYRGTLVALLDIGTRQALAIGHLASH